MYKTLLLTAALVLTAPVALTPKALVRWDQVTTDINGNPTVVVAYELALFNTAGAQVEARAYNANAYTGTALALLLEDVQDGAYTLRVRAQSAAGVWSDWSAPLAGALSTVAPVAPQNVKVR